MNSNLLVTIIIVSVCIIAYVVFLMYQHKKAMAQTVVSVLPGGRMSQVVISDAATYRETKESMRELRSHLDRFFQAVDAISAKTLVDTPEEADATYQWAIPMMHYALVDARNTAQIVYDKVMRRSPEKNKEVALRGESFRAPGEGPLADMEDGPFGVMFITVEDVNPSIAGFYYSFTDPDESTQTGEAVIHMTSIIKCLDLAISQLLQIEETLVDENV